MEEEKKKVVKKRRTFLYRTGEDIDMLNESRSSPQERDSTGSYRYKDHIDGA